VISATYNDNESYEGNQLIYVPLHTLKAGSQATYKSYKLGFAASYTGVRETSESADQFLQLDPYMVFDLTAGVNKKIRNADFVINFRIDNLFDKAYEVMRSYPLPGRTFHLSLMIGFSKTNTEN
jgi:vitamin B12 transporter